MLCTPVPATQPNPAHTYRNMEPAQPEARPRPTGAETSRTNVIKDENHAVPGSVPKSGSIDAPDYVVVVKRYNNKEIDAENLQALTNALEEQGMYVQIRPGGLKTFLVLVKCQHGRVHSRAVEEVTQEWLYGLRSLPMDHSESSNPDAIPQLRFREAASSLSEADKLRLVYDLITRLPEYGGAGIRPNSTEWPFVEQIYPVHNPEAKKEWARRLAKAKLWGVSGDDIEFIRSQFGEKVALYFAFVQFYFVWSLIPAIAGLLSYYFTGGKGLDMYFATFMVVWSAVFVQAWNRHQTQMAVKWHVKGTARIGAQRSLDFKGDQLQEDPITGVKKPYFAGWKRACRQLLFAPLAFGSVSLLITLQTLVLGYEILVTQIYDGPFKSILGVTPPAMMTAIVIVLSIGYTLLAKKFNQFENYETLEGVEFGFTLKQFIFTFFVSYMPLFLTAYVYLPFGHLIDSYLSSIGHHVNTLARREIPIVETFQPNTSRLRDQVFYFAVIAPCISLATETVVPFVMQKLQKKEDVIFEDDASEAHLLKSLRTQAKLPQYTVHEDYRQLVVQFGYTVLFSTVWPLAPLAATINLWVQMRGDAAKICFDTQRPVPRREESVGPWTTWLSFLSMLGSMTNSSVLGLASNYTSLGSLCGLVFVSENLYMVTRKVVQVIMTEVPIKEVVSEYKTRFNIRKRVAEETDLPVPTEKGQESLPAGGFWQTTTSKSIADQIQTVLKPLKTSMDKKNE